MPVNQAPPSPPATFATLARRISGWTTNLLATALVAVLALVIGRQLIAWWGVEPGGTAAHLAPRPLPLANVGAGQPLELGFGSLPYQLQFRTVRGDQQAALDALTAACRELAAAGSPLDGLGSAEEGLLALAAQAEPVARGPGSLEVFASPQGMPLVVVTGAFAPAAATTNAPRPSQRPLPGPVHGTEQEPPGTGLASSLKPQASSLEPAAQLGAAQRRVVTWGLAAAAQEGEWNLYIAHAGRNRDHSPQSHDTVTSPGSSSHSTSSGSAATTDQAPADTRSPERVPIPPGSQRCLALWDPQGGGLVAFAGNGPADAWMAFYADWFGREGWTTAVKWRQAAGRWHARYQRPGGVGPATVDVQFGCDGAAGLLGFLSIAAADLSAGQ